METLPWKNEVYTHYQDGVPIDQDVTVLEEGGHISTPSYGNYEQGLSAMLRYVEWRREDARQDSTPKLDWVGKKLVADEFFYEAFNKTRLTEKDAAGGMSYNEREDTYHHQNADLWILRWRNHDVYRKFKVTLLEFFELPYSEAEWLIYRARKEDEETQRRRAAAEAEKNGDVGGDPGAIGFPDIDIGDSLDEIDD